MSVADIKNWIQIALLILTHGKEVVEALGEIIDEVKSWFHDEDNEQILNQWDAMNAFVKKATPLVAASKGRSVSVSEVKAIGKTLWDAPDGRVAKMSARKQGKSRRA